RRGRAFRRPRGALGSPVQSNVGLAGDLGRKLPVIGSVMAGSLCEAFDEFNPGDAEEWIEAPGPVGPNAFVLRIEGVSMEPRFMEGDKVVIDPALDATPGSFVDRKSVV